MDIAGEGAKLLLILYILVHVQLLNKMKQFYERACRVLEFDLKYSSCTSARQSSNKPILLSLDCFPF